MKIIAVLGGKGGCGKSSCSIGLSFALAEQNKRVLLIDLDQGMRCLDMLLSVSEDLLFDVSDAVGGRELSSCVLPIENPEGVYLLAAPAQKDALDINKFAEFIRSLSDKDYDTVIIDLPAGSDIELYKELPSYTEFLCICNPNAVSVRDAANIAALLSAANRKGSLIINRYEPYFIKNPVFASLDDIIDQTGLTLLGIVPESEKIALAFLGEGFTFKGKAKRAFGRIANRLYGRNVPLPRLKRI